MCGWTGGRKVETTTTNTRFSNKQIGAGSLGGTRLLMRMMQHLVCSVNKFSCLPGTRVDVVFFFIKWGRGSGGKISWHGALIYSSLSPLSRIFILGEWWASSFTAKLSSQMVPVVVRGGQRVGFPYFLSQMLLSLLWFFFWGVFCSDYQVQPTCSVWL